MLEKLIITINSLFESPIILWGSIFTIVIVLISKIIGFFYERSKHDDAFHDAFEQMKSNDPDEHLHVIKQSFKCPYCGAESSFDLDLRVFNMYHIVGTVKCEYCDKHYDLNDVLTNEKFEVFKMEGN